MKFRVLTLTTLIAAALHVSAFAVDSELGGVFSGFVKKENSPYLVKETLVVPEGQSMLVESGVELRFAEGTGIDVRGGSLAVVGESNSPVKFTSAKEDGFWNGISITGSRRSEIQYLQLENAEYGFTVESGSIELRDVTIERSQQVAVYVRNGSADIQWSKILGSENVGVWATQSADVTVDGSTLEKNHIALVASDGADVEIQRSKLIKNDVAILNYDNNRLSQRNSLIEDNQVGYLSRDLPSEDIKRALSRNVNSVDSNVDDVMESLGDEPRNPFADGTKLYTVLENYNEDEVWKISGNFGLDVGFHQVFTRRNDSGEDFVSGDDTIKTGSHYKNYFQVPGLFANWNANMMMESPTGQTVEFTADISNDSWDKFKVHSLQAVYSDQMNTVTLGDVSLNAGEIYLAGINAFGGMYELKLFENAAGEPLFVGTGFLGETRAPKVLGERDYDVYNEYIEDGEAQAQNMIIGGRIRWNMHHRFNGTLGFVGSKDYLHDPFLREGQPEDVNTADPLVNSRNFFADGNWLFFPGDIKLNGQIAVGAADTVNVARSRAINQVFSNAGLDASNNGLLNKLMKNPHLVNTLSRDQLESIFGDNTLLTPSEMRARLTDYLEMAANVAKGIHEPDVEPTSGEFWDHNHVALAGSYEWSNENTFIEGFFRYVGKEYYSAGSNDLLQNTRKLGGNLRQKIFDFWKFSFGYVMNVENAAGDGNGYNIFGMAEGSQWGMFSGAESDWLKEHEQDENRTLYIHDAYIGNDFKLNEKIGLSLKYSVNYRTRSSNQRLYANYSISSGIYEDDWFRARDGHSTIDVIENGDTVKIDSVRWAKYYSLSDEEYLATQFEEKLLKHTLQLGLTFNLPMNVLKVGSVFVMRSDYSEFVQDDLLKGLNLSDKSFGILGYYFHGSDFFEQRYPISLTTKVGDFRNTLSVMPRYKIYNRYDMTEFEWSLDDNMSFPMVDQLLELTLSGGVRQNFLDYEIDKVAYSEMELDVNGSVALRVNHNDNLYTEWTIGTVMNYRPDNLSDQYKDLYAIASLNYSF